MSRNIKILIIISLLLNVLLVGIVGGHMYKRSEYGRFGMKMMSKIDDLPADKRDMFRDAMKKMHDDTKDIHDQIRAMRADTINILSAEDFNEKAYQDNVKKMHDLRGRMMHSFADTVAEMAKKLPPEERKILAEVLRRPPPPFPSGGDIKAMPQGGNVPPPPPGDAPPAF